MKKYVGFGFLLLVLSCAPTVIRDGLECFSADSQGKQSLDTTENPSTLRIKIFRDSDTFRYPEQEYKRYQKQVGIAISGGGFRSYSCAIGQVKALMDLGVLDSAGMLSVLSGSSWFAAPFVFAHDSITDSMLFNGAYTSSPSELTVEKLQKVEPLSLGYPLTKMSDEHIVASICESYGEGFPGSRLFNSLLRYLLSHFQLDDKDAFFTLNSESEKSIIDRNPTLKSRTFYLTRKNRPFLAVSSTLYDSAFHKHHKMHHMETTPLYFGTKERSQSINERGDTNYVGGGYIEHIGVNSKNPLMMGADEALIPFPEYQYTLFDMIGTSGSAPGSIFCHIHIYNMMSEYNYWPVVGASHYKSELLSFVDGGDLENMAIIPLLRRGYKRIIAFDNVDTPIGSAKESYDGISYDIARLFGHKPENSLVNTQSVQVFPKEQFENLASGLKEAVKDGIPYYHGKHTLCQNNPFGITSYTDSDTIEVLWIVNGLNNRWKESLPREVQSLFHKRTLHLDNFPYYKTVFQNGDQMFKLNPEQVNLLANMWYYSLTEKSQQLRNKLLSFIQR